MIIYFNIMSLPIASKKKKSLNKLQNQGKESNTLDNKHRLMVKQFSDKKSELNQINEDLETIKNQMNELDKKRETFSQEDIKTRAKLLSKYDLLNNKLEEIEYNYAEMEYYDKAGDLITDYYEMRDVREEPEKQTKNILDFLSLKKKEIITTTVEVKSTNRAELYNKYCERVEGLRVKKDDGSNRIKYCSLCDIEKILDMGESAYICPICGEHEEIIFDEDRQIKEYSPYKRLNHFKEWLNQFQAKQSPDIPEQVFRDIVMELNKNRINDLSVLNRDKMKGILKKLDYNIYYEHVHYIINKLNNLPPPKITKDMEKLFITMFTKIQEPWLLYKQEGRKNFLSYSYVLHKFCELLELDHLLECFPLHKYPEKIMENDQIWEKICRYLNWQYISSFK